MRWYAVHTHAKAESKARFNLQRQGFDTYLPLYLKKRRHARRTEIVRSPLFPRYLFVFLDMERMAWRAINSTFGVIHLVCQGERPVPVPEGIMSGLKGRETPDGLIELPTRPLFGAGDPVRIVEGAFSDRVGLFQGQTDQQRVNLLLDMLGRQVKVTLPLESVEAAS